MAVQKGRLVKRKKDENDIYFVLSVADSVIKGSRARIMRVHPSPREVIGYVDVEDLVPCGKEDYRIGDALSRLVVRNLFMKGAPKGISMRAGATIFKPFQFRPLLSYLENPRRRILIADEVGLGKTISASYIMVEEMARSPMERIVIICPSHLRSKWRTELLYRFGIYFDVVRGRRFLDILGGRDRYRCIVSIDALRGRLDALHERLIDCPKMNMLIVDEAHHLIGRGGDTQRREFVQSISLISDKVIGLTATPLHLELMDLKRVLDVIDPRDWTEEVFLTEMELRATINKVYGLLSRRELE